MKTVAIIQARMTSTRLPGKVLLPLEGMSVLGHVLTRCKKINGIDAICCAIPLGSDHDVIEYEAKKYDCLTFRGSEDNVLERYYEAAKFLGSQCIMRITSDCPLFSPKVCSDLLDIHLKQKSLFTCNNTPPSWPHGYDCEIFGFQELEEANAKAIDSQDLEHVTPWIRRSVPIVNLENPNGNQYSLRLTLDTKEDYEFIKSYIKMHGNA